MKVTKTNVFRLELEKDACACRISREYSDGRYASPLAEPVFAACEKHGTNPEVAEFAKDTMIEWLAAEAKTAGAAPVFRPFRPVTEGDSAGVVAEGENVQALGVTGLPKLGTMPTSNKPRHNPMQITKLNMDRPTGKSAMAAGLNVAGMEDGIEISGAVGAEAPEDDRVTEVLKDVLGGLEADLDRADAKEAGVPLSLLE